MRKAIKFLSAIITLIILFFIITIIVLTHIVNPNDYKKQIDKYVFQNTGRHLSVSNVGWSFLPWLGVDLKNAVLANPAGFNVLNFAKIGEIKIKVRLLPLLAGNVQLGKIVVKNANINLVTNNAGKHNWSNWSTKKPDNTTSLQATEPVTNATIKSNNKTSVIAAPKIHIAGISVTHSTINFIDEHNKTKTHLSNFNLTTGVINNAKDFPINFKFNLQQSNSKNSTKVMATALLNLNVKQQIYTLRHLVINTATTRPNLPTLPAWLKGDVMIDIPRQTLTVSRLTAQLANMRMQGKLRVQQLLQAPQITAHITSKKTDLQPFMAVLVGKNRVKGTLYFDSTLTTSGTSKKTLVANLRGKGNIKISDGAITGLNLNNLMTIANAIIHQKPASHGSILNLTSFSNLSGSFLINNGILKNNDLQLDAGQTTATGTGCVNLNSTTIDYVLTAQYQKKAGMQPAFELPIMLQGPLNHPRVTPDYNSIAKQVLTNSIEHKIKDYAGKAGKRFNLNTLFKGL